MSNDDLDSTAAKQRDEMAAESLRMKTMKDAPIMTLARDHKTAVSMTTLQSLLDDKTQAKPQPGKKKQGDAAAEEGEGANDEDSVGNVMMDLGSFESFDDDATGIDASEPQASEHETPEERAVRESQREQQARANGKRFKELQERERKEHEAREAELKRREREEKEVREAKREAKLKAKAAAAAAISEMQAAESRKRKALASPTNSSDQSKKARPGSEEVPERGPETYGMVWQGDIKRPGEPAFAVRAVQSGGPGVNAIPFEKPLRVVGRIQLSAIEDFIQQVRVLFIELQCF